MHHAARSKGILLSLSVALVALISGCGSLGPKTLDKDQLDYGHSIGNNWKNQMLANIVKLRFVDMPVFVDVGSIVSGYTLETQVSGRLGFNDSFTGTDSQGLNAGGRYTDRPTITYMPKTGTDYLRSLLEPVEPSNVLALIQAGYNAELLFTWAVESVNGVGNYGGTGKSRSDADPEFYELTGLLVELQALGAIGFEIKEDPETGYDVIFRFNKDHLPESLREKSRRVGEIINLEPGLDRFKVIYSPYSSDRSILAMQTRSVLQMLSAMSGFVDIPAELSASALPGFDLSRIERTPFFVHSSEERPEKSFARIKYNGYWYWIENNDLVSKRVFTLMLFLTTLTNQASDGQKPVLTIPTG